MTRGVVIALGVAAVVLAIIVFKMMSNGTPGIWGGVPYYTPSAPNTVGGPPLPASNKLSTFLQGVTATAKAAGDAADSLTSLWQKTGKSWINNDKDAEDSFSAEYVDSLPNIQA